ncbi:MAG: protein kinase [Acidobacteriota bacterium]
MPHEFPARIGPYAVKRRLGAGAMGVVLLARDVRLGRSVALKALPARVAQDAAQLARFKREARLLAALHHPNIASLHGFEEHEDRPYLAMEYVEGETLRTILARGALDLDQAIELGIQIACGLAAAHDAGIIHRDLKPSNVMVTPDGRAKLVDFGLAKDVQSARGANDDASGSESPTRSNSAPGAPSPSKHGGDTTTALASDSDALGSADTTPGAIIGTAAYMSPEQARGRPLDRRTDVWAFGCVLFECLTGERVFPGVHLSATLLAVLEREPDWSKLPATTPPALRRLLERCLRKAPRRRLRDLGDVELLLSELNDSAPIPSSGDQPTEKAGWPRGRRATWPRLLIALLAGALLGLAFDGGWLLERDDAEGSTGVRLSAHLPSETILQTGPVNSIAFTPDGRALVAAVRHVDETSRTQLVHRSLDDFSVRPLDGSEGAQGPFVSPDGAWVAFTVPSESVLKKVSTTGGAAIPLGALDPTARGGTWLGNGTLIVGGGYAKGLLQIAEDGGAWEPLTTPDRKGGEKTHRFPFALPGDRWVVFTVSGSELDSFDEARIDILDLETHERRPLIEGGSNPRWSPDGQLVFVRRGGLSAIPVDLGTGQATGPPRVVLEGVISSPWDGTGQFDISPDGHLAFAPGGHRGVEKRLVRIDRGGQRRPMPLDPAGYEAVRISPDGQFAVIQLQSASTDLWLLERGRGALSRLTQSWDNTHPVWSPDGGAIAFASTYGGREVGLTTIELDSGTLRSLGGPAVARPLAYSPDGEWLLAEVPDDRQLTDIVAVAVDHGETRAVAATAARETAAAFSPDGGYIAYASDLSGQSEVYVEAFLRPSRRLKVSMNGGTDPVWRPEGESLVYRSGSTFFEVALDADAGRVAPPQEITTVAFAEMDSTGRAFDLSPGGDLVVPVLERQPEPVHEIRMIFYWAAGLRDGA